MKKIELIVAGLAVVSIPLGMLLVPGGAWLTMVSLFTLSGIYFGFSFALFNGVRFRKIFDSNSYNDVSIWRVIGAVGVGIGLSSALTGIAFKLLSWTGADVNLIAGLAVL